MTAVPELTLPEPPLPEPPLDPQAADTLAIRATRPHAPWRISRAEWLLIAVAGGSLVAVAAAAVLILRHAPLPWILGTLLLAAAAVAMLLVLALTAFQRGILRIRQLRDVTADIGLGDLSVRAPVEASDELGLLGLSLNAMADRVARVLQAQKDLLAGVSHELRSPLTRIEVACELIRIELEATRLHAPAGVDRRREGQGEQLLGEIHEEVVLLERHIQRLLEAQRVGVDRVLVQRKPLSLDELVQTVVRREKHRLEQLGFTMEVVLDSGNAVLHGDENALDRVLSTLIENAVTHACDGEAVDGRKIERELRIETARDELNAIVRVHDRGPGLTTEQCTRVFEAFYRTDRSRDAKTGGTGLGLYLVKRIAEGHGGTARALPREGGGLTIELRLPVHGHREHTETVRMRASPG